MRVQRSIEAAVTQRRGISEVAASEPALVARAARGDRAAFGELYQAYLDRVYGHVCFRLHDAETAADLTQEVFLKAFRKLDTLKQTDRFAAWLFQIAHNAVINHQRRRWDRPTEAALLDRLPAGDPMPEEAVGQELDLDRVLEAAAGLTDLQRQVLALRFVSGLSVAETASIMDRRPNAIHNLQHNALAALRRQLSRAEAAR